MSAPDARPSREADEALAALLAGPLRIIHVGLDAFSDDLAAAGALAVAVDWRPPAGGNARLVALLAALEDDDATLAASQDAEGGAS